MDLSNQSSQRPESHSRSTRKVRAFSSGHDVREASPEDDCMDKVDILEKKRVQNRIAQRNYRQNVKRKIIELENKVAVQASLLAQFDANTLGESHQQPSPTSKRQSKNICDNNKPAKFQFSDNFTLVQNEFEQNELQAKTLELDFPFTEDQAFPDNIACHIDRDNPTNNQKVTEWVDMFNGNLNEPSSPKGIHKAPSSMIQYPRSIDDLSSNGLKSKDTASKPPVQPNIPSVGATVEEKIYYLLHCARSAGFESIDAAMVTYLTADFKTGSVCASAQRLCRNRRLPELLEKLRLGADSWPSWESQAYMNAIIKSAEHLLLNEIRNCSHNWEADAFRKLSDQSNVDLSELYSKLQNEVTCYQTFSLHQRWVLTKMKLPNLCSVVTTLLHESVNQSLSNHQLRLVQAILVFL